MRQKLWALLASGAAMASGAARASDKPLYQPVPAWVKPAPTINPATLTDASPLLLSLDRQDRLADGVTWNFTDTATRMASPEVVAQSGTLTLAWQPAKGDLVVHRVEILRGAERIDLVAAGKRFEVIRREQQLEQSQLDGQLTATLAVSDLRVGDVLHVVTSTTVRESAFPGMVQAGLALPALPAKVGFARARLLWPTTTELRWRSYVPGVTPTVTTAGGMREVSITGVLPKADDLPDDAPLRYRKPPILEATNFADWAAVSRAQASLYAADGLVKPGAALAGEIARIAAASSDPAHRAAAALQLVQDKVRYLAVTLDNGGYVPQPPEQTWAARYGDCKAKTLLLLAMLKALGVEAEPVLASSQLGDLLPDRLPGAAAFDHILVRASIGGDSYWLDGTGGGSRFEDLADAPPLHWVLPLRRAGAALMPVPARAPARPAATASLEYDQSAGLGLPTLVRAVLTVRGPMAEMIGLARSQGSKEQNDQIVGQLVGQMVGGEVGLAGYTLSYDPLAGVATVDAHALVTTRWHRRDGRYRMVLDKAVSRLTFEPDRARPGWRNIPVATGTPGALEIHSRVKLPADVHGVTLDGDASLDAQLGGAAIHRTATVAGDWITVDERTAASGAEIAPAEVPAMRARVALAKTRLLEAVAPADTPARWAMAQAGRRDGRFRPILASYAAAIADDPKEVSNYVNRANFLLGIYDWRGAMPDLDQQIALEPTADRFVQRADVHRLLGEDAAAVSDARAALGLDPASAGAIRLLGETDVDAGRRDLALARVQERVDAGGQAKDRWINIKANLLARAGQGSAAIAALDAAIAAKPGVPTLLNERCWIKGELNTALDTALKDCTRAIELTDSSGPILDSRALVFWRLGRLNEALADVDAALDLLPEEASSLYLRGVIRAKQGKTELAAQDLLAAKLIAPLLPAERRRYGIAP